jgi:hypothetical protein
MISTSGSLHFGAILSLLRNIGVHRALQRCAIRAAQIGEMRAIWADLPGSAPTISPARHQKDFLGLFYLVAIDRGVVEFIV